MENKTKKKHFDVMKQRYKLLILFAVISLVVCGFSFRYYKSLHNTIREESYNYLREVSRRIASNLDRITADNFAALETMAGVLEAQEDQSLSRIHTLLQNMQEGWDYENVLLIDRSGHAYDIKGEDTTFFAMDDSMRKDLLEQKQAMSNSQMLNNKEYIIFAVPLENVVIEGQQVMALVGCYDPVSYEKALSMTSFDNKAYSQIVTRSGTLVTRTSCPYSIKSGYNIFSTLQKAQWDEGDTLEKAKEDIADNKEGQVSFSLDGIHRYMVYTPISPEEWYLLTFVPFQAVNAKSDLILNSTILICVLIVAAFSALIAVLLYVFAANRKKLEKIAYVDEVTGGNTIQRFYELCRVALETRSEYRHVLMYTNIENFKVLNAQFGREVCDSILQYFDSYMTSTLEEEECMGRVSADNFCVLLRYTYQEAFFERMGSWANGAKNYVDKLHVSWSMPYTEFGVYVIEDNELTFPEMIDRAKMALKESRRVSFNKLQCAFYDDNARRRLFREKQLTDMMEDALENGEFKLYLQPKYKMPAETIGGAEALVRWDSPTEGMIYPDEFISLFEKNGFIVRLDLWMLSEVCRALRSWMDRGLSPMKISVNCSRVHLKNEDFLKPYIETANQYKIDRGLIEIELTESVVFENTERLTHIIEEIRRAGFGCSMDDFGSGYSSLNLIQSIPVDTLKIDKIFFKSRGEESERTEIVVGGIIRMARALSMITVAEGVEYREQIEMLKRVECDYIQGYVYAKPMKVKDFESLAFDEQQ